MQWLYSLGITEVDWKNLTMTFVHHDKKAIIRGDPSLTKTRVSLKNMMRTWDESDQGFLVECRAIEGGVELAEDNGIEEHLQHLEFVLEVLRKNELYANKKKCSFARTQVEYLENIISGQGVEVDPAKIRAIREWPTPTNVREVKGFLGLTGYYRKFVQHYGTLAAPLTQLLKLVRFKWTEEAQESFTKLQNAMMTLPVLALPDFSVPFEIETDAFGYGIGAMLIQARQPIAYDSHTLAMRDRAKPVYERELMAVVLAVRRWRWKTYLLGRKFVVKTNQRSSKFC
ncbi:hypothetical protein IC582_021135 [Cucumis melo]